LALDLDPLRALEIALNGDPRRLDLGRVNGRPFLCVACTGFDGEVLRLVERRGRLPRGPWVYPLAVLRALLSFVPPRVRIDWEEDRYEGDVVLAAAANAPMFGGGMRVAPTARMDDGLLDLVIVKALSRTALLRAFPRIYSGRHLEHPAVIHRRVERVTIESDTPLKVHGDGEPLADTGEGRVRIEAVPGAISLIGAPRRPPGESSR
jgi:diacylglycerol kinase family enzyme